MAAKRVFLRRTIGPGPALPGTESGTTYPDGGSDPSTPGHPGIGDPLAYASDLAGWRSPQFVPGSPQRMPGLARGPVSPLIGVPPSATVPTPTMSLATTVLDPHHYAAVTEGTTPGSTTSGAGSAFITQPAGLRNMLLLRNPSTNAGNIYIGFGNPASLNSSLAITPGQTYLFDEVVPQNDLYAFSAAGETLVYAFSNIPVPT